MHLNKCSQDEFRLKIGCTIMHSAYQTLIENLDLVQGTVLDVLLSAVALSIYLVCGVLSGNC